MSPPFMERVAAEGDCSLERPRKLQLDVNDNRTSNETAIEGYICNLSNPFGARPIIWFERKGPLVLS